jgi:hypothetical protein
LQSYDHGILQIRKSVVSKITAAYMLSIFVVPPLRAVRRAPKPNSTEAKKTAMACRVSKPFFALLGGKTSDKAEKQISGHRDFPIVMTWIGYCPPLSAGAIRISNK